MQILECEDDIQREAIFRSNHKNDKELISESFKYKSFQELSVAELDNCMKLIEENIKDIYIQSGAGWSKSQVLQEIQGPDGRFLLLDKGKGALAYFQFSTDAEQIDEDGNEIHVPCVYLLHIHVSKSSQTQGIGTNLMDSVCKLAKKYKYPKVKLTVFKVNQIAVDWYLKLGFDIDCTDLSNYGEESSYFILSKDV